MREPTDRERARALEVARRTVETLPKRTDRTGDPDEYTDEEIVELIAAQIVETAVRRYSDDSWVDAKEDPPLTLRLDFLRGRLR